MWVHLLLFFSCWGVPVDVEQQEWRGDLLELQSHGGGVGRARQLCRQLPQPYCSAGARARKQDEHRVGLRIDDTRVPALLPQITPDRRLLPVPGDPALPCNLVSLIFQPLGRLTVNAQWTKYKVICLTLGKYILRGSNLRPRRSHSDALACTKISEELPRAS